MSTEWATALISAGTWVGIIVIPAKVVPAE